MHSQQLHITKVSGCRPSTYLVVVAVVGLVVVVVAAAVVVGLSRTDALGMCNFSLTICAVAINTTCRRAQPQKRTHGIMLAVTCCDNQCRAIEPWVSAHVRLIEIDRFHKLLDHIATPDPAGVQERRAGGNLEAGLRQQRCDVSTAYACGQDPGVVD